MRCAIIIVTYNSQKHIQTCLETVGTPKDTQIIIVDNASTDETVPLIQKKFSYVTLIEENVNRGYAGGNNGGIAAALQHSVDAILILNPDVLLTTKEFEKLVHKWTIFPKFILGPVLFSNATGKTIWAAGGALDQNRYTSRHLDHGEPVTHVLQKEIRCTFIPGACMLIPTSLLTTGLRFYENYFMYYEEVEFCVRAKKHGFESLCVGDVSAVHAEESVELPFKKTKEYYLARNHVLFVERNAPFRVQLREMLRLPKTWFEHKLTNNRGAQQGIYDYLTRQFGKKEEK